MTSGLVVTHDTFINQRFYHVICCGCISNMARLPVFCDGFEQSLTRLTHGISMKHCVYQMFSTSLLLGVAWLPVFRDGSVMSLLVIKCETFRKQWFYHAICGGCVSNRLRLPVCCQDFEQAMTRFTNDIFMNIAFNIRLAIQSCWAWLSYPYFVMFFNTIVGRQT